MAVLVALLASVVVLQGLDILKGPMRAGSAAGLNGFPIGGRLLIIAPHPDDEGLATAGLIQQALAEHCRVEVVVITSGDGSRRAACALRKTGTPVPADFRAMGTARVEESIGTMKRLGLPEHNLVFLGYPDGGLNSMWDYGWDYNALHKGMNGYKHSPYRFAFQRGAPYCGANLAKNLVSLIKSFDPSTVVFPDAEDDHHDHWAANAFVQYALAQTWRQAHEYTYLVHRLDFPQPRGYLPRGSLTPPPALQESATRWQSFPLSPREERVKGEALSSYRIPTAVAHQFIESFVRSNELLGMVPPGRISSIGDSRPDLDAEPMPYVVNSDPPADLMIPWAGQGAEITRVAFARGRKLSFLGLETLGQLSSHLTYTFRLRLFKGPRVERADIGVAGGKVIWLRLASNSIKQPGPAQVFGLLKRLWIEVPSSMFAGRTTMMMSVDAMVGPHRADRTSWQRYQL